MAEPLTDDEANSEADEARPDDDGAVENFLTCCPGGYQAEFLVDTADFDRVMRDPAWHLQQVYGKAGPALNYFAHGHGELLHRVVLSTELAAWTRPGFTVIDYVNGNRLDNRHCNLHMGTYRQDNANRMKRGSPTSSRFKGLTLRKRGRWRAQIQEQSPKVHLGYFDSEEEAAHAYAATAHEEYGEFTCFNFALNGERCALRPQPADEPQQLANESQT